MRLQLITAPWSSSPLGSEPLTLGEAKTFLKVDAGDDDTLIDSQIRGARNWAEKLLKRALITQTWELTLNAFPAVDNTKNQLAQIHLPLGQTQSLISFKYVDEDGVTQDMVGASPAEFQSDLTRDTGGLLAPEFGGSWPAIRKTIAPILIRFTVGYGTDSADIPAQIMDGIRFYLGQVYEGRGPQDMKGVDATLAEALLGPFRLQLLE